MKAFTRNLTLYLVGVFAMLAVSLNADAKTYTYFYDTGGRLTHIETAGKPGNPARTIIYTYDAVGQRTSMTVQTQGVDVAVALNASPPGDRAVYNPLSYTARISNIGSVEETSLTFTFHPDSSAPIVASDPGEWVCAGTDPVVCTLAYLAVGSSSELTFDVVPNAAGPSVVSASVSSSETDLQLANNVATVTTLIMGAGTATDTDGDGLPNAWEIEHGFDPNNATDAGLDSDGDGLNNLEEYDLGTDPNLADTDGDREIDSVDANPLFNPAWLVPILAPLLN